MTRPDRSAAAQFQDADVVEAYRCRPDYPPELYGALLGLLPGRGRVLDLGCGPGKIARAIAGQVDAVDAIDPSALMLALGQALDAGRHRNIRWIEAAAEELDLPRGALDLAVAGAAIHWMNPEIVFPKLADALAPGAFLAMVEGDEPSDAPWRGAYMDVIRAWIERLGGEWNGAAHRALMDAHAPWFDVDGEAAFIASIDQGVEDFVAAQHSRATWARRRMGALAKPFDDEIRAVLAPWTRDGKVSFQVRSRLTWGRPRRTARRAAGPMK